MAAVPSVTASGRAGTVPAASLLNAGRPGAFPFARGPPRYQGMSEGTTANLLRTHALFGGLNGMNLANPGPLGLTFRALRQILGLTQRQHSKRLEICHSDLSRLETGKRAAPGLSEVGKFLAATAAQAQDKDTAEIADLSQLVYLAAEGWLKEKEADRLFSGRYPDSERSPSECLALGQSAKANGQARLRERRRQTVRRQGRRRVRSLREEEPQTEGTA